MLDVAVCTCTLLCAVLDLCDINSDYMIFYNGLCNKIVVESLFPGMTLAVIEICGPSENIYREQIFLWDKARYYA